MILGLDRQSRIIIYLQLPPGIFMGIVGRNRMHFLLHFAFRSKSFALFCDDFS